MTTTHKPKLNPMLLKVIGISLALHLIAALIFGSMTIIKHIRPSDTQFQEPPPIAEETPPVEVKIKLPQNNQHKNSGIQNLRTKQIGNITLADVSVDLPAMEDSFTITTGLGNTRGGSLLGNTSGGLGMGMSDVNLFGIQTHAERLLFIINANRSMVADNKGGIDSYQIVKDEITDRISNLAPGAIFNVFLYDGTRVKMFKPTVNPIGNAIQAELKDWLAPINATVDTAGLRGTSRNTLTTYPEFTWSTLDDTREPNGQFKDAFIQQRLQTSGNHLTQLALEQGVDAIFILTGHHSGFMDLNIPLSTAEKQKLDQQIQAVKDSPEYQAQLAAHQAEIPRMQARIEAAEKALNEERKAKGQKPKVFSSRGVITLARALGLKWENEKPKLPYQSAREINEHQVKQYFRRLTEKLYTRNNQPIPSINIILFQGAGTTLSETKEAKIKEYTRAFGGSYRILRGAQEIQKASKQKK